MSPTELTIPRQFCGPPDSANGGWTSGALAQIVTADRSDGDTPWPTAEVTLRTPPPLDVPLTAGPAEDGRTLLHRDDMLVAEARLVDDDLAPVDPVDPEQARAAMTSYAGLRRHPFPTCFTCGPERAEGDGLRIFPGPVAGTDRVASTWTPHASTQDEASATDGIPRAGLPVAWAALDCPGGWATDIDNRPMVLGRITARIDALPVIGEEHVVVGQVLSAEGRRTTTATTLYDADGRVVGRAQHVWIEIDPATFGR